MSCDRFKDKVGYKGQSHVIKAEWPDGTTRKLGWQNGTDLSGWASLAKAWQLKNLRAEPVTEADK